MKRILLLNLVLTGAFVFNLSSSYATSNADNSGKNAVDRSGQTVTPESQSNAPEDVDVTAAIRRAIVKNDSLSTYAHNIKIITTEKHVVYLRGPVASADEIGALVKIARKHSGDYPVKNELSVSKK